MGFNEVNALARSAFMMPPSKPKGETTDITFMGFELVVEIDYQGAVEGIISPDGTPCYSLFEAYMGDINKLVEKKRAQEKFNADFDRAADLHAERLAA